MKEQADWNTEVFFSCPKCSHEFKKTFEWLEMTNEFSCPAGCGLMFRSKGLIKKLNKSLYDAVDALNKSIRDTNKILKF